MKSELNKGGRPRVEQPALPVYDSMKACHSATGIPMALLKEAKDGGCDAFRSNRVELAGVLRWIFAKDRDSDGVNWPDKLKEMQAKREAIKLAKDERSVIDRGFIKQENQNAMAMMFGTLDRAFLTELPAQLKGRNETQIRDICLETIEAVKTGLREQFDKAAEGKDA